MSTRNVYIPKKYLYPQCPTPPTCANYTRNSYIFKKVYAQSNYTKETYVYSKCLYPHEMSVTSISNPPICTNTKFVYPQTNLWIKRLYKRDVFLREISKSSKKFCILHVLLPICASYAVAGTALRSWHCLLLYALFRKSCLLQRFAPSFRSMIIMMSAPCTQEVGRSARI